MCNSSVIKPINRLINTFAYIKMRIFFDGEIEMFSAKKVDLALRLLTGELINDNNKEFIKNNPSNASNVVKILMALNSAEPSLDLQKNFDGMIQNLEHVSTITDIFQNLGLPLRTQGNLDSLFRYPNFLADIQKKVIAALPYAGGVNPIPPIDQKRFDEIIREIKSKHEVACSSTMSEAKKA